MKTLTWRSVIPFALASIVIVAACGRDAASDAPPPASARSVEPAVATPMPPPVAVPPADPVPAPETGSVAKVAQAGSKSERLVFTDVRAQAEEFIGYYRSIKLTPEQERIKVEALSTIPAPCCSEYSLATCCCPCNMAKSAWGMAAWLITEKGYDAGQVRQAALDWIEFINPDGFTGTSCSKGGCMRPFAHDGCGGMKESELL